MTARAWLQIGLYLVLLLALAWPLGAWTALVLDGLPTPLDRVLRPVERALYRVSGVRPAEGMDWRRYAVAMLALNASGFLAVYALQRLQAWLPFDPQGLGAVAPSSAFNTAASFVSNTDWQDYAGETTLSYATQMLGLTVQNFLSAATGLAVLAALIRGLRARGAGTLGNFWVDVVRATLYVLLPLSLLLSLALVSQGVVQTFEPYPSAVLVEPVTGADGQAVSEQILAVGPAASQVAIKQLGTNGGGFFNANSSHPFENPTPFSNLLEVLAILLIPAALCHTYGRMVGDRRQGRALLGAMTAVFVVLLGVCVTAEQAGNPRLAEAGIDATPSAWQSGGNMEGKEVRFGITGSALWAAATTAASNGSVNSMHDSYTPLGGLVPLFLIELGEVIYGGVGSGLYGMLAFVLIAVFVAGLMVGRSPEYLGKRVEAFEMKMSSLVILVPPALVLLLSALASVTPDGVASLPERGPHGLSQILYAFSSMANNNGSAFAGLDANVPLYNLLGGLAMLAGRYWLAIPMLAVAGSLARKRAVPAGSGTLETHTPLFVAWLVALVLLVGALAFVPVLALGPIVEQLLLAGH